MIQSMTRTERRKFNNQKVFTGLRYHAPIQKTPLAKKLGMPPTTVHDALTRLILLGVVTSYIEEVKTRGRRPRMYIIKKKEEKPNA
jgi:predicted ArsR family transcriptional regulator